MAQVQQEENDMPKTVADVPPVAAAEFIKAPRPEAIAEADGAGYAKTMPMQKAQQPGKRKSQFGLPKSGGVKAMKMK
jgi:hypothetical protein